MATWTFVAMAKSRIDFVPDSCFLNREVEMVKVSGTYIPYMHSELQKYSDTLNDPYVFTIQISKCLSMITYVGITKLDQSAFSLSPKKIRIVESWRLVDGPLK